MIGTRTLVIGGAVIAALVAVIILADRPDGGDQPDSGATSLTPTPSEAPAPTPGATPQPELSASIPSPTPHAPLPSPAPLPRPVHYAPGEVVNVPAGMFFVDPRTGAVDGWAFPARDPATLLTYRASPRGRYIAHTVPSALPGPPSWRMFDTRAEVAREIETGPPVFAPDESAYALAGAAGITIHRAEDGAVMRTFPVARFGDPPAFMPHVIWAPDGGSLLAWFQRPPAGGGASFPPSYQLIRLWPDSGDVHAAASTVAWADWSADGRWYYTTSAGGDTLTAFRSTDDTAVWAVTLADLGVPAAPPVSSGGHEMLATPRGSPDRSRIAVTVRGAPERPLYRVWVLESQSGRVLYRVEGASRCSTHAWTADGRWLLVHGRRGEVHGSYLVAADGSQIRYLAPHVEDLSPRDATIGGVRGRSGELAAIDVIGLPDGAVRRSVVFAGDIGWDALHDPLWLPDGRMVVHAPHGGHGGCGFGPPNTDDLDIRFP